MSTQPKFAGLALKRPFVTPAPHVQLPMTFEQPAATPAVAPSPAARPIASPTHVAPPSTRVTPVGTAPVVKKKPAKTKKAATPPDQKAMKALQLERPEHALLCVPTSYMDCRDVKSSTGGIKDEVPTLLLLRKTGQIKAFDAQKNEVHAHPYGSLYDAPWPSHWKRITNLRIELEDEDGELLYMSAFGAWGYRTQDPTGTVLVHAIIRTMGNKRFLNAVEQVPVDACGAVYPRYTSPGSSTSEVGVRQLVNLVLADEDAVHWCKHELVKQTLLSEEQMLTIANASIEDDAAPFASLEEMILALHQPDSPTEGKNAGKAARAIGIAGVCHVARRNNERTPHVKSAIAIAPSTLRRVIDSQPEALTSDQVEVVDKICTAFRKPAPLTSLLSGDVGTGKTLAFAIPCVAAHLSGARVALLSPTEILANQVFNNLSRRFPFAKIERVSTGKKIMDDTAILVGTSGLSSVATKQGYKPDVVVIDEQHKLSTEVRAALCQPWTHLIEASATPIPRSLASSLFAGMEVFNLRRAPVTRDITSVLLDEKGRAEVSRSLRQVIAAGDRAAFIYPLVESDANSTLGSVSNAAAVLSEHFPNQVGILHGKMKPVDLNESLDQFRRGDKQIMVASTVMETGIDVPDIRLLVVRDADRFGAAQLHQLRGRLARNGGKALFAMLVSSLEALAPETHERLSMVAQTMDGYALAEADMRQRGIGDLTGDAQSGNVMTPFRLINLTIDDFEH